MRSFALFFVLLTSLGFTAAFVPSFVPSVRTTNAAGRFLARKQNNEVQIQQGMFAPLSQMRRTSLFSSEPETEVDMMSDIEYTKGMPDKSEFGAYYRKTVSFGMEMTKQQFMAFKSVELLLLDGLILPEDVADLWISAVGDASGLNEEESYEMLCMVLDLPDPDDIKYLDEEFVKLTAGKSVLSFFQLLAMSDVQDMLSSEALNMEEITDIWRAVAGDLNKSIDRTMFGKLNVALDDFIDAKEEGEEEEGEEGEEEEGEDDEDEVMDLSGVDVWADSFDPSTVFDKESLKEITDFFLKNAGDLDGQISLKSLMAWDDVKNMLEEEVMTEEALKKAWKEAAKGGAMIGYDAFLRLNVRLDLIMDELEVLKEGAGLAGDDEDDAEEDAEAFYRSEFKTVTGGGRLMRLDMLLEWKEVKELIDDGVITQKQVTKMFDGMPKEPMGIPATTVGIAEDTFVAFNGMLDVLLDASSGGEKKEASVPSSLVSEPPRPMPAQAELTIGSMGQDRKNAEAFNDDPSSGLSENELELMQALDKADNMLNSGSYGDFDQLIGDVNDPRLQALREERDGADEVRGDLKEVLKDLLALGREQKRCGLDKPDEETSARIRDLVQAVFEKSPRMANKKIEDTREMVNGKWKLMYTNSEMFEFYHGLTGFANVFPTAKFEDLTLQYTSDGYLNEAQYFEKLVTPLGPIDATVYSTWDLMKEMSFMTNENSVVLRSYCSRVTAGPMEYEAQENWKSLRTMSMNELMYVDENIKIMRNCGALRIYFIYERIR